MPQHPALSEGRVAVITGGASGIGLAAAKRFAAMGMKLCLADLSQDALDRAAAAAARGADRRHRADRCQQDRGGAAPQGPGLRRLRRRRGADEQRRHLAGGGPFDHHERWRRVLGVNLWGVINGVQAFTQAMIDQRRPARSSTPAPSRASPARRATPPTTSPRPG